MYGKHFASMYEGSMLGIGAVPLAVWGYVISHMDEEGHLELNPVLLAAMIGESEEEIQMAMDLLQEPDPNSRCKAEEGRRLVRTGQFSYRVPSAPEYRKIWNRETQKEYNRVRMREWRAKQKQEAGSEDIEDDSGDSDNGGRPEGVDEDGVIEEPGRAETLSEEDNW